MYYTSSQVRNMTYEQWMDTIAKELNAAGFKARGYNSETGKWQDNFALYEVRDYESFFMGGISDVNALEYLKSIGLVNNGRCPECGNNIYDNSGRFTSGFNSSYHFQICQDCVNRGRKISMNPANKGCLISLLFTPWYLVKSALAFIGFM